MENLIYETKGSVFAGQPNFVPNELPRLLHTVPYRIAIVGEAPGADEVVAKRPFVGVSGRLLDYLLSRVGILRSACYLGNVSQLRPPGNDITAFEWKGEEIQEGLRTLRRDIDEYNPNLCLLLGATSLRAAKGYYESITNWRGSLFLGGVNTPFAGRKCIATYHPASALRVYEQTPLILFDLKRARTEGESRDLVLPERHIEVATTVEQVEAWFAQHKGQKLGTDIEGYVDNLTCISFADSPTSALVIPFSGPAGNYWADFTDEHNVWLAIKTFLEDPSTSFVLQNGLYDRFVLAYTYGILITNVSDDTMAKHWELYCELPKRLSLQASIYTKEPFYKDERDSTNFNEFWNYNGKDSCVTLEISNRQDTMLNGTGLAHYQFNMELQSPLLYMELRGMRYDSEESCKTADKIRSHVFLLQHALNKITGQAIFIQNEQEAINKISEVMCIKKVQGRISALSQIEAYCRKSYLTIGSLHRALKLCEQGYPFDDVRNGELSMLLDKHLNTASSQQLQVFLYGTLNLPTQLKRGTKQPTTDALALLSLYKKTENPILKLILKITQLRTQLETLEIKCDPDNRIRCSYNVVGTETGRLSCKQSPTRSGYNLQTVTKKQRRLFLADTSFYFFQCDLSGADGWTVAAHCKRLGDSTMFDDYTFGLKPAKLIALMYNGTNISQKTRQELSELSKTVPNDWLYMACKRVQHGSNYLMGKLTMSNQILQDGWKYGDDIIYVEPKVCEDLQVLYFQRYTGVQVWHRWVAEQLKVRRELCSANGHVRRFFGRTNDNDTLKQALADEPQNNTTYVTNQAALRLWNDRENRTSSGALIIEPLHQVHDALCGQFPIDRLEWSLAKIRSYFDSYTTIAGQRVRIPFEGAYGRSWGELNEPI